MEHPCSVPYSTLRNTLQLNRSLVEKNMAYMISSLSEMILILWGKGEYLFLVTHSPYLCSPIAKETGLLWVSMEAESKSSK